ncbi:hypothetical protein FQR65_LT17715 [Abscondita terminalis]|nr:hypothetical protein FQR65_LT17715 [Abscondita terminalis]
MNKAQTLLRLGPFLVKFRGRVRSHLGFKKKKQKKDACDSAGICDNAIRYARQTDKSPVACLLVPLKDVRYVRETSHLTVSKLSQIRKVWNRNDNLEKRKSVSLDDVVVQRFGFDRIRSSFTKSMKNVKSASDFEVGSKNVEYDRVVKELKFKHRNSLCVSPFLSYCFGSMC